MYSSVDFSVTPRPMYPADGRKIPDIYAEPPTLRHKLNQKLGQFPLFHFWGPTADIISSKWIAESAKWLFEKHNPTLTLIYLPHLDYNLQRLGPHHPNIVKDLGEIDRICRELIRFFRSKNDKVNIIVLSEYAIHPVSGAIHINRVLREHGYIRVKEEMGTEKLDAGASKAFAVSDHQIAHVYIKDAKDIEKVKIILEQTAGIEKVLDDHGKKTFSLDHPRCGELIALADPDKWFTYYYWLDDKKAPDFARTVDIHRKPGYDPVELFIDPKISFPLLKIAGKLLAKKLGFRSLFDVISLDSNLVQGSHGIVSTDPKKSPVFISSEKDIVKEDIVEAISVKKYILKHLFGEKFSDV